MTSGKRFAILFAVLLIFILSMAGEVKAKESAYRSPNRPMDNFMKVAMTWDADDLKEGKKLAESLKVAGNIPVSEEVFSFGRRIFEKYKSDISGLIHDWEKHISEPLPVAPKKNELVDFENPQLVDLNFCENLSCTLAAVTQALAADGNADDAVRLFLLNLRFNQYFAVRDGFFMGILVANKVSRVVIGEGIWGIINSGKVSPPLLKEVVQHLSRLRKDEVDFSVVVDNLFVLKRLWLELFKQDCLAPEPAKPRDDFKINEVYFKAVAYAMSDGFKTEPDPDLSKAMFDELINEANQMFAGYRELFLANKAKPAVLIEQEDNFYEKDLMILAKVDQNGLLLDTSEISNIKFLGRKYFTIYPDPAFVKLYLGRLELKYRILGTGLLAIAMYEGGEAKGDLQGILKKIENRLPPDIFTDPVQPCRIAIKDNILSAWSVGKGGDQNGDPESDILLFSITR